MGRLVLVATSPRVAPGLLVADAWDALRAADLVLCGSTEHPQLPPVRHAGIDVELLEDPSADARARRLLDESTGERVVVWLSDPSGDGSLGHALGAGLARLAEAGSADAPRVELEVVAGSYDLPGAHLLDLVQLMDRLRSPGGCPWDAEQTHESLLRYLVEETYELVEAVESGDRTHLREELGDLLLQVVFHARIATEHEADPFDVDDVADGIVTKLVARHPHVFDEDAARSATSTSTSTEQLEATWDRMKAAEKGRTSVADGIPPGLPALALAEKLLGRVARAGLAVPLPDAEDASAPATVTGPDALGDTLLRLVEDARASGLDAEGELRRAVGRHTARVRAAEGGSVRGGRGSPD